MGNILNRTHLDSTRVVPTSEDPCASVDLRYSWDCTIRMEDWQVNCGSLCVACDEASPHNCRASSESAHDQAASISLDRVDGIESFVLFEMDLVNGRV